MNVVIFAVGLLIMSIIFLYPIVGLAIIAFFTPMQPLTVIASGRMSAIKVVGIYTFFCWLIRQKGTIRIPIKADKIFWLCLAFGGWAAMSLWWSRYPDVSLKRLFTLIQVIGLFILSIDLINSEKRLNWIIGLFIAGSLTSGIVAWRMQIISPHLRRLALEGQNPNGVGIITAMAILLLLNYLYNSKIKNFLWKVCLSVIVILLFSILIFTQSRGAWVGFIMAVGTYFLLLSLENKNLKEMLLQVVGLSIAIIITFMLISHFLPAKTFSLQNRVQSIFDPTNHSIGVRYQIWKVGFTMWANNPFIGVGIGNFPMVYDKYLAITPNIKQNFFPGYARDPHNVYLSIITELGTIGFLIWGALLFSFFKVIKDGKQYYRPLMLALFIFLLTVSLKGTYTYNKYSWLMLSFIVVSSSLNFKLES